MSVSFIARDVLDIHRGLLLVVHKPLPTHPRRSFARRGMSSFTVVEVVPVGPLGP